jgi:serine/threonine-protein kinase
VRPSRILLLGQGAETFGVKLMGHGALRAFSEPEVTPQALGEEAVYLAPEQWLDAVSDARSDVYSLGMLIGRALLGRAPYPARGGVQGSTHGSSSGLVRWTFSAKVAVNPAHAEADARLDAVILNATRKRPENRYSDASELLADLSAIVGVSNHEVVVRPLLASPDAFEPRTERGRAVARRDVPA